MSDERSDDDLADGADHGLNGLGNVVRSMTRLRKSNEKLTKVLAWLTGALIVLTAALVADVILRHMATR